MAATLANLLSNNHGLSVFGDACLCVADINAVMRVAYACTTLATFSARVKKDKEIKVETLA